MQPVVVLLHGFMQSGSDMDCIAHALKPRFRVIAPTMTVQDANHAKIESLARFVRECIVSEVGDDERVAMLGYSMGGRVALAYARLFPETLSALVLESAGLGPEDETQRQQFAENSERLASRIESCSSISEFVDYWETLPLFAGQKQANPQAFAAQRESRLQHDLHELALITRCASAHTMPWAGETRNFLNDTLPNRVLYIAGQRDVKYAAYADSFKSGNVQVSLFDCGHNVHMELLDDYCDCVSRFLQGISS